MIRPPWSRQGCPLAGAAPMPDAGGPWRTNPPRESNRGPARTAPRLAWLPLVAVVPPVALLSKRFPGQPTSGGDRARLAWGIGLVVLVSVNILSAPAASTGAEGGTCPSGRDRRRPGAMSPPGRLRGVGQRYAANSRRPTRSPARELGRQPRPDGGFYLMGQERAAARFLVDTGASETVSVQLTRETYRRRPSLTLLDHLPRPLTASATWRSVYRR